jgi:hypothetical protein
MIQDANERFERVILGGMWDFGLQGNPLCQSYNIDHWRCAGFLADFWNPEFLLRLDRHRWEFKPEAMTKIIVNVTHGKSSPFPYGPTMLRKLEAAFPGMIMDTGPMVLPRFMDLLNYVSSGILLVCIDTGILWLSEACPWIPVVQLASSAPWGGSVLRRQVNARISYREATLDPGSVIGAIERILEKKANPAWKEVKSPGRDAQWPKIFLRGSIDGESDIVLRHAAIRAWREVLGGAEPPMLFDPVMRMIANRLGVETHDLIAFSGQRKTRIPQKPQNEGIA